MQPPSLRTTTLNLIEEGAMAVVQKALPEEMAMTIGDETLTGQGDRQPFSVAPKPRVWVWPRPEPFTSRDSDGGEVGQQGGRKGRQVCHGSSI